MTYYDSPSRLLSEITNYVLHNTISPVPTKLPFNHNVQTINGHALSPCVDTHLACATTTTMCATPPPSNRGFLETALQRVRNHLSELPPLPLGAPFMPPMGGGMQSNGQARPPRRALKDDVNVLAQAHKNIPSPTYFALVEFKRQRVRLYKCAFPIRPSQYLVIAGDRGEDLGLCVWVWSNATASRDLPLVEMSGQGRNLLEFDYDGVGADVRRIASAPEIHVQNHVLPSLEVDALRVCREKAVTMNIPIDVIDVEYQFDRKKITYYFVADGIVDFRQLVRELWHFFNTRIWLEKVPRIAHSFRTPATAMCE